MPSIFLSHSHQDKPFVRRLAERLMQSGVVVWLDEIHLGIGDSIIGKIADAIEAVDYVAAVISKNSVRSQWVQKELSIAMSKEISGKRVVVLPILLDDCKMPTHLQDKLYVDFRDKGSFEASCCNILRTMGIVSTIDSIRHGMWIEWDERGPRIVGHGVVISTTESASLLDRWHKWLPTFVKREREKSFEAANLLAVLRACFETYNRVPDEEEMKHLRTDLARKFELFFAFTLHMASTDTVNDRNCGALCD
jgi:TIR domain